MTKVAVFLLIIFVAVLGYLAILNQESVSIRLSEQHVYDIPQIALILLSTAIGSLSMLAFFFIRDTRRYFESLQNQRHHKKERRIQESYTKGLDALSASRYEEAAELFNRIIEDDPGNVNAMLRRGDIALRKGDFAQAKDSYMKAKDIRPQSVEALFSLERVFENEKNWQGALRYLDNILEIDEENPKALYKKRDIYERTKNWEALLEVQNKVLKSDIPEYDKQNEQKNLLGYKYELGRHYLEKGDIEKAIKTLKAIIKTDKGFVAAYLALAESYISNGENKEAEKLLTEGYEATSALVFLVRLEDFFITTGEPGRIIDLYQKAIQINPNNQELRFFLAKLYYRLEMIDYAIETVTGTDIATIDYPEVHLLLGGIYERQGEHDRAIEEFKNALNFKRPLLVPFCCSDCKYITKEWVGRCPECRHWNTLTLDLSGTCKI
ncbi:tetratricopeptide repeat protein [bacterium]|nr:MAG: tetratricopeptide repeat protein [bacterium]